mmetsp:Transcript_97233/g.142296  ORF Transcript_97233/g.142296 Transcript_97233/m.142296 type:complete len:211 (+) Transcript_97233:193-825(+)
MPSVDTGGALLRPLFTAAGAVRDDAKRGIIVLSALATLPPPLPPLHPPTADSAEPVERFSTSPPPPLSSCVRSEAISASFCANRAASSAPSLPSTPSPAAAAAMSAAACASCASCTCCCNSLKRDSILQAPDSSFFFSSRTASSSRSLSFIFISVTTSVPPLRLAGPSSTLRTREAKLSEHAVSEASVTHGDAHTSINALLSPPSESCKR